MSFVPVEVSIEEDMEMLTEIGRLRYLVWKEENAINLEMFPSELWIDPLDTALGTRHWVVYKSDGGIIAAARLTIHHSLDEDSKDTNLWRKSGRILPLPTTDLGRLVVRKDSRGRGIAQSINIVRIAAAREIGAKSIMVTASEGNARLLLRLGFEDTGERIFFDDRPRTVFFALQLNL